MSRRNDLSLCISNVPKIITVCTAALLSERKEVINNTTLTMKAILKDCVALAAKEENIKQYEPHIRKVFDLLTGCLKYQYHSAWKQVLFLLATMYKVPHDGTHCLILLLLHNPTILAGLRQNMPKFHDQLPQVLSRFTRIRSVPV